MYCLVAVNPDGDRWVAFEFRKLLTRLEQDCGGGYDYCYSTHHVAIEGGNASEATGWMVKWNDGVCAPYDIIVTREEVIE